MSYGGDDDETLRLRVVYEASQVVKEAIADIRQLKEETGELNKEQEKTLQTLEYQKTLLEGAGSGLDHYTALVNEEVQAQKYYHQVLDETNESLKAQANAQFELDQIVARNQATIQASTADFSKLGGQIMAAEKAAQAIVSGHGLGRIGGMLEKVTLAVGGPAGLGMALGAVAMALEGMLPKIEDWLLKWETGSKTIDEVKKALDSLDKSEEEHDRKRALRKVERQISRLEKKEDEQGFLTGMEQEDLDRLEAAAFNMRQKMAAAKKVEGIGGGKEAKARGAAVREAIAESGTTGEGIATLLSREPGISYDDAVSIVAGALEGSRADIAKMGAQEKRFAAKYAEISPEAKQAQKAQRHEDKKREQLTEQGRHLEEQTNREREQARDRENKETERLVEQMEAEGIRIENQGVRDDARKRREAEQAAKRAARANAPQAHRRAAQAAEHEQVAGAVEGANAQFGFARTQGQLDQVTRQAVANVNMGADLASAVQMAVFQTQQKIQREFMNGMNRMYSGGEMRGQ